MEENFFDLENAEWLFFEVAERACLAVSLVRMISNSKRKGTMFMLKMTFFAALCIFCLPTVEGRSKKKKKVKGKPGTSVLTCEE